MRGETQRKTVDIDRGLFLVRYATAEDEAQPPKITVTVDDAARGSISVLTHPDEDGGALWRPGSCLVVRALRPGALIVEVLPHPGSFSRSASVRVETLTQGGPLDRPLGAREEPRERSIDVSNLTLVGHVAGIGDVRVPSGEWLGGPKAPSRIEGISIEWPGRPNDIALRYAVTTARPHAASQRVAELGAYAGTRGKALSVVGVALELSGPAAAGRQLSVDATFLGSPMLHRVGPRISLAGPTGREPLVGLKLSLEPVGAREPRSLAVAPGGQVTANRVRVFKSRAKASHAAAP
jgi:hypothetical protein